MSASKWMKRLQKLEGAVLRDYDPFQHTLVTRSPSLNWIFGNSWGLPEGYSVLLAGPDKSGKTLVANAFAGQTHQDNPDSIVVKYNTEMRETLQLTDHQLKVWGIDPNRYMAFETKRPEEIFDKIETDINAMCQEGAKIKLIIIDSATGILGRRGQDSEGGILVQQRGDKAATMTDGLDQIMTCIRRNKIGLILTTQVRAEQDANKAKYKPFKAAVPWATRHFAEYFIGITPNNALDGKEDILGNKFIDQSVRDLASKPKGEITGHKIRVVMEASSCGPKGRVGEFTINYSNGIVGVEEEIFKLATRRGVVPLAGKSYLVKDFPAAGEEQKYVGKPDFITAIKNNEFLSAELVKRVRQLDIDVMRNGKAVSSGDGTADMTDEENVEYGDLDAAE